MRSERRRAPPARTSAGKDTPRHACANGRAARMVGLVGVALSLAACASRPGDAPDRTGQTGGAILSGTPSDAAQDAVVLLQYDPFGPEAFECSGTLIAPNLVLTARHCVSETLDGDIACTGTNIGADYAPAKLNVVTGSKRPSDASFADAHGERIFHDDGVNLCAHDLALVLLDRDIPGAKVAPLRLDAAVTTGETFTAVGWGVTQTSAEPSLRQQRAGLRVDTVGPSDDTPFGAIAADEFVVGESICEGDSGGPALSARTGAVLGVVSRGGNGQTPNPDDPSADCVGATNLYSTVAGFRQVILDAFAAAHHTPWREGDPDPSLAPFGGTCATNADCQSALCHLGADGKGTCTVDCSAETCAAGFVCQEDGSAKLCVAAPVGGAGNGATTDHVSCRAAPGRAMDSKAWLGAAAASVVAAAGRRRRARRARDAAR